MIYNRQTATDIAILQTEAIDTDILQTDAINTAVLQTSTDKDILQTDKGFGLNHESQRPL